MLRPFLLVIFLTQIHTVYVTDPTFADRLDRLYEKVEKFTIGTPKKTNSKLYAKLDRLNSLTPDRNRGLSDDDEELLSAMQMWGSMSDEQLRSLVQEIQQIKDEDRSDRLTDGDYDGDWPEDILSTLSFLANCGYQKHLGTNVNTHISQPSASRAIRAVVHALSHPDIVRKYITFPQNYNESLALKEKFFNKFKIPGVIGCIDGSLVAMIRQKEHEERYYCRKGYHARNVLIEQDLEAEGDYHNDGEEWDPLEDDAGSTSRPIVGVTPSAFTRLDTRDPIDFIDPIAATNERPRILDDSNATPKEKMSLRKIAFKNVGEVFRSNDCLVPQPRWLYLRNLAPAADTVYMPPCVKLHRCAPDACCCKDERQECAPIDGKYVAIPVYLGKPNRTLTVARMLFFNHTRCSCIYRDSIESTARTRIDFREDRRDEFLARRESVRDNQNDWRAPTEEPKLERDEEQTSPPQLRRCTCPTLFRARIKDGVCSCVCDWPGITSKRGCFSLARGKEHFGLRDRVCVAQGDCSLPSCEYGAYEMSAGRCPARRVKRRFHSKRFQDKV